MRPPGTKASPGASIDLDMNPHQHYPASLLEIVRSFRRNRGLIWQMAKREVVGRYRGSLMGLAWSFFNPILVLVVYTFVVSLAL